MDAEIKNRDLLEKALEEQVIGEVPEDLEGLSNLRLASDAMEELVDIQDTIRVEGVSQEDIRSVFSIIKRLNSAGVECNVSASMEDFEIGHYTPQRTIVNLQVSQEGIGTTLVNVIKAIFEKLLEFVSNTVRFFKVQAAKDVAADRAFDAAKRKARAVQKTIDDFKRYNFAPTAKLEEEALAYAKTLLLSERLPRSYVTLAALRHRPSMEEILTVRAKTERAARTLRMSVKNLKSLLMGSIDVFTIDTQVIQDLTDIRDYIGSLQTIDPEPTFITKYVKVTEFVDTTLRLKAEPLAPYEYIIKAYFALADDLRTIRKFNQNDEDPESARLVSDLLQQITLAFEDLNLAIKFFAHVKAVQLNVFSLQLAFLNRYISLFLVHLRENTVSDMTREKIEKEWDALAKHLSTFGLG